MLIGRFTILLYTGDIDFEFCADGIFVGDDSGVEGATGNSIVEFRRMVSFEVSITTDRGISALLITISSS